LFLKLTDLIIG